MLDRDSIFGDFSDEAFSRGMCKLITKKTLSLLQYHKTRHEDFQKILNPDANQKILDDIKIKVFDDFSEKGVANGVDRLIDTILREHLFYYPKSKAINPLVFGDFSEEAIINAVTQIIDERILASCFHCVEVLEQLSYDNLSYVNDEVAKYTKLYEKE